MCEMCDGKTLEEIHLAMRLRIAERGWDVIAVEGDGPRGGPWAYTVGLCDGFGHPELVIADVDLRGAVGLLDVFAQAVHDEEKWFCSGDVIEVDDGEGRTVRLAAVHPSHHRSDLLNGWHAYYRDLGLPVPRLRALQLVLSDEWFCQHHGHAQRDLSRPALTSRTGGTPRRRRRKGH